MIIMMHLAMYTIWHGALVPLDSRSKGRREEKRKKRRRRSKGGKGESGEWEKAR
jgi:hypothetical protein